MARFCVDCPLTEGGMVTLPKAVTHHIRVLRLQLLDSITLFNGNGGEYLAQLTALHKHTAQCQIVSFDPITREAPLSIRLAQAISVGDKMEFILQKAVELGITQFQPVISERTVVRLSAERAARRQARWQTIVIAACEQSGRNILPQVRSVLPLSQWLNVVPNTDARFILSPRSQHTLCKQEPAPQTLWLLVGPEGGLSGPEEHAALTAGWQPLVLGPRILRTETAALAAIAAMQTCWGDFAQ